MIESRTVSFVAYGIPQPQGSKSARVVRGRAIMTEGFGDTPRRRKEWRMIVADAARQWLKDNGQPTPFDGPIDIYLSFFFLRPPSVSAKKRPFPSVKPDLSKLTRSVEDSMTGLIYRDDAQIVRIVATKDYASTPRVEVRVIERTINAGG